MYLASITVLTVLAMGQAPRKAPPKVEEALRTRIGQFYTLFQQGKFRQAEAFVAEDSKDAFYGMTKSRHLGFDIRSMSF